MIMAGQGTAALELLEENRPARRSDTPVGGGGLLSGCATIAKAIDPSMRVFGAEPKAPTTPFFPCRRANR